MSETKFRKYAKIPAVTKFPLPDGPLVLQVVNTKELKRLVDQRARTFALEYVPQSAAAD